MKITRIRFIKHPLLTGPEFDLRDKAGRVSNFAVIAGQNGMGKSMFMESLACIATRFKDSQPHQIALFDYEFTVEEFEVLVSDKLNQEELSGLNKNRVSVKVTSQFQNGRYINTYEFHLYKLSGEKIFRYDLSDNFESIRKVIYISINGEIFNITALFLLIWISIRRLEMHRA